MVVLLESVAVLMELRAVPQALRALSDWLPMAALVVPAVPVVPDLTPQVWPMAAPAAAPVPVVRAVRAVLRVRGGWLLTAVPVAPVAMRGPRVMVPPVPQRWQGLWRRVTALPGAPVVLAVTVVTAVQAVSAGLPRVMVPWARRALSAWLLPVASVVPVLPAVLALTPRV
jgi:hypothetical protein